MKSVIITLCLLLPSVAQAQTGVQKAADWTSTGLVGVNLVGNGLYSYRHHCMKQFVFKNIMTVAAAELTKLAVHEDRPDHSDQKSFYSEHSALAMANYGWNFTWGMTVAIGAGGGRVVAKKHHPTDVVVGLLAGLGAEYIFPCEES